MVFDEGPSWTHMTTLSPCATWEAAAKGGKRLGPFSRGTDPVMGAHPPAPVSSRHTGHSISVCEWWGTQTFGL